MEATKKIVVGVDSTETGALALRQALEIASLHERAEVHAVRVVEPIVLTHLVSRSNGFATPSRAPHGIGQQLTDLSVTGRHDADALASSLEVRDHVRSGKRLA